MQSQGPAALLPLGDMLKANREHWVSIYPRYVARLRSPSAQAETLAVVRPQLEGSGGAPDLIGD
jgi:hypothetical protein